PQVLAGYRADVGLKYGLRRSGLRYGWNASHEADARERANPNSPDQRYDTFIHMTAGDWWSVQVPNGRYVVRVVAGDPDSSDSDFKIDVEGTRVINAAPRGADPWVEGAVEVVVRDGNIGMVGAAGAVNNKVAFLEIRQMISGDPRITWTTGGAAAPDALLGRSEPGVIQVGRRLFVLGGYIDGTEMNVSRSVDVYNLQTKKWTRLGDLPAGAPETHMGLATDGTYIYSVGGQLGGSYGPGTTQTWRYDIGANTWQRWVDLPQIQYGGALAYLNGGLYFFGGDAADRFTPLDDHWAISTRSRNPQWVARAPLPDTGDHLNRTVVNGKIYAIGGEHGHAGIDFDPPPTYVQHDFMYEYDPAADTWTRKASMPIAASHSEGTTFAVGEKIFVLAGLLGPERHSASVRVFDTLTDRWTVLADLPDARIGPAAGLWGGRVYFTVGYSPKLGFPTESYLGTISYV
ncbi:MAG: hypothetical protein M3478_11925, partial [Planctomycetota bacterium]|nr:hypothetical protein [Planctomycetota bacterium]